MQMERNIKQYFTTDTSAFDVSFGVLLFISRWLSITIIIFSSEILIEYGMLGTIGFMVAMGLAFVIFSMVARSIKRNFYDMATLEEIIQSRTEGVTKTVILSILFLLNVGMLIIQAFAVHLMLKTVFEIPIYTSQMIFYLLLFIYAGIGGIRFILKLAPLFVITIFSSVILIPVYFFIQEGFKPVYDGIWLYHPYLLYWKNNDNLPVILTSFLLYFSMLMVDHVSWQRLLLLKTRRVREALSVAGIIIVTILLALLSMILISLSDEGYVNAATVLFHLIKQLQTPILIGLFIGFCLVVSLSAFGSGIHVLVRTSVYGGKDFKKKEKRPIAPSVLVIIIITILFFISFYAPSSLLDYMFLYGVVSAAMILPMLVIIFMKNTLHRFFIPGILISIIGGIISYYIYGAFLGIWTSFSLSIIIMLIQYIDQLFQKKTF